MIQLFKNMPNALYIPSNVAKNLIDGMPTNEKLDVANYDLGI